MVRISGVDLPRNKRIDIALTYIFGLGPTSARKILDEACILPNIRSIDLKDPDKHIPRFFIILFIKYLILYH